MEAITGDNDLLVLIRAGDAKALMQLRERYYIRLLKYAFNITRDVPASEDIVNGVFISLWEKSAKSEIESMSKWLFTAVKYSSFRENVVKSRTTYLSSEEIPTQRVDESLHDKLHEQYLFEKVREEVGKLPQKEKEVFQYSRFEGLTNDEIAQRLNISKRTVETHIRRAIGKLRKSVKSIAVTLFSLFI